MNLGKFGWNQNDSLKFFQPKSIHRILISNHKQVEIREGRGTIKNKLIIKLLLPALIDGDWRWSLPSDDDVARQSCEASRCIPIKVRSLLKLIG